MGIRSRSIGSLGDLSEDPKRKKKRTYKRDGQQFEADEEMKLRFLQVLEDGPLKIGEVLEQTGFTEYQYLGVIRALKAAGFVETIYRGTSHSVKPHQALTEKGREELDRREAEIDDRSR